MLSEKWVQPMLKTNTVHKDMLQEHFGDLKAAIAKDQANTSRGGHEPIVDPDLEYIPAPLVPAWIQLVAASVVAWLLLLFLVR